MRKILLGVMALVISLAFVGNVLAADAAATYKTTCAACHGAKGEGMPGMAPAIKGNESVVKGKAEDIKKLILEGRAGATKKYKEFPVDMPKAAISAADADVLVKYLKSDMQK